MSAIKPFPVEKEYVKHPEISPDDIKKLREWLDTQPHLPGQHLSDLDLLLTFYCCENSAEVSKQVLDLHYTLRTIFTPLFNDRKMDRKIITTLHTVLISPLPTSTVLGYRAVYCRLLDSDARKFVFADAIRAFMMIFDLWQYEEGTWSGFVILIDMDTTTLGHVARMDLMSIRQILYFLQECMLVKLKEVHFLNAPFFMDKVMMLLKPFMKKSLLDMIRIHEAGSPALYDHVPLEAFPKEFGGGYKNRITLRDETIRRLEDNKQFYKEENLRRVNESLRPSGKKTTVENLFGIQGSFKKLDID